MIKLLDGGAYLVNGAEIVVDDSQAQEELKAKTGKAILPNILKIVYLGKKINPI